jgi:hypothetical protein
MTVQPACVERGECPDCGAMACVPEQVLPEASAGQLSGEKAFRITAHQGEP